MAAIKSGWVTINGVVAKKPSLDVRDTDVIVGGELPYSAGRGSLKLQAALDAFNINPMGWVCLDVGASTGGFTDVLLSRGAARVIAVDVGTNQLAESLKNDSRVTVMELTDIRALAPVCSVDLIVVDVSFISLTNIMDSLVAWGAPCIIALIKPQFELTPKQVPHGIVKTEENRQLAIKRVQDYFEANLKAKYGGTSGEVIESPIKGTHGNTKYLWHVQLHKPG